MIKLKSQNHSIQRMFGAFSLLLFVHVSLYSQTTKFDINLFSTPEGFENTELKSGSIDTTFAKQKTVMLNSAVSMGQIQVGNSIGFDLFGEQFGSQVDKIETNINGTTTIRSRLVAYPMGFMLVSTTNGLSSGVIHIPELGQQYSFTTNDRSGLAKIGLINNESRHKNQRGCDFETFKNAFSIDTNPLKSAKSDLTALTDSVTNIDIMIVYTPATFQWFNKNSNGVANSIANQVAYLNLCLENSLTKTHFTLVYSGLTDYTVIPSNVEGMNALNHVQGKTDGYMDEIHALRDVYHADIVTLVVEIGGLGGISSALYTKSGSPEISAFNVCSTHSWAWSTDILAHEVGHNFGAGHNRYQIVNPGPHSWGETWPENKWSAGWKWPYDGTTGPMGPANGFTYYYADVMSYGGNPTDYTDTSECINVPYFSNPDVKHKGYPTGDPILANNARTIRELRNVIASYRNNPNDNCVVSTQGISYIIDKSANVSGKVEVEGNTPVTARGIVWSTNPNPTISDFKTLDGNGLGAFTSSLNDLSPRTKYYYRAYATNNSGTRYGDLHEFETLNPGFVLDYDKNTYDTVHIGNQIWMRQNLKVTHFKDGSKLPNVIDENQWINMSSAAFCDYNNDSKTGESFGHLYNWYAVSDQKCLCPNGWRVPSLNDWDKLTNYLGGDTLAVNKLIDEDRFDIKFGGLRYPWPNYDDDMVGLWGFWWSSTEKDQIEAKSFVINSSTGTPLAKRISVDKKFGFSVRCIMGDPLIANAGTDQFYDEGITVMLDGTKSMSSDVNTMIYQWTAPAGITLSSNTIAKPSFTAPEVVQDIPYTFSLVVSDGTASSTADQVVITVKNVNKVPVANAGPDQTVNEGIAINLDGLTSSDPDGTALTYQWTAPTGIILSSNTIAKPSFTAPEVIQDTPYTFSLVVSDGTASSTVDQVVITVKNVNKVPIANAGPDQTVNEGITINLDGSASTDPDGNVLTYQWSAPTGITLSSNTIAKPIFTAPEVIQVTPYIFSLVVSDGTASSTVDQVVITVKNVNKVPVANAGPDQTVNEGIAINLDGSASTDPDGSALTYQWTAPAGIILSSNTIARPIFTAPEVTQDTPYTFSLFVSDGTASSTVDQVVITVKNVNKVPVANAGPDQTVNEGIAINLDGSTSSDPDGTALTYQWTAPAGIILNSNTIAKPSFTAPEVTQDTPYTFSLVVSDGTASSTVDQVVITVKNVNKVPVANAGSDQTVNEGIAINLDGSTSTDPDGSALTYQWTAPTGISLSSNTIAKPTFTAPEVIQDTPYTFSLVVSDGTASSTVDQVVITVKNVNKVPVANAGQDKTVNEGIAINLDGSTSTDPDGTALTYQWTAPTGITLSSTTIAKPSFTAPEVTQDTPYTFSLVVSDGTASSTVDQVVITVKNVNKIPIANAGPDQTVNEGAMVMLNGSASSDPDNDPLVFKWMSPKGIVLNNSTVAKPIFTAPEVKRDTTYIISLVVNDRKIDSPSSAIKINVLNVVKVSANITETPNLKVYPNPTTGEIFIEFAGHNFEASEVTLLNSVGAVVLKKQITVQKLVKLDLSNLVNGLYLIKLKLDEQNYFSKILLQK